MVTQRLSKDVFRKLQRKGNFPKCCKSLSPWTGAEFLKNIWFSRLFLCGFQGCFFVVFKVFSSWFPCDLLWFGVGFSLWIPPFTLSSCPLEWPFTLHCLMQESDTFLVFLNSKWLIKGGLMPEVIHGVGLPHGELGLVSTLM